MSRRQKFALNTEEEDVELDIALSGYGDLTLQKQITISGDDLSAINTFEDPNKIVPVEKEASGTKAVLPALSWNVLIMK
ncbi:MAG: hypothetical protein K6G12_05215 [Lachnospiraceae bacterium]|nr:hypothetical protein [Lachnospiraceae bacterium]